VNRIGGAHVTRHASRVTSQPALALRLEPEFYKPADGFGTAGVMIFRPSIDLCDELVGEAHCAHWVFPGRGTAGARALTACGFGYCLFHD